MKTHTVYARMCADNYLVAASIDSNVRWTDEFSSDEEEYWTIVVHDVPAKTAKSLELHGTTDQVFSDGYEAYNYLFPYIKHD